MVLLGLGGPSICLDMFLTYLGMESGIVGAQSELLGYSDFISRTAGTNPSLTREHLDHAARCIRLGCSPGLPPLCSRTHGLTV